ncbi:MAG: hypothetical protein JWP88_750 [Flaviaesturariibacter sp.]|nr:hypothetical protein [Flaviaesturariibacter sp.]
MKRLFTSALALLLIAGAAQAQTTEKTAQKHAKHQKGGGKEFAQLNLSADQKAQMKSLHEKQKAEAEALKANKSLSADQQKEQRKALHEKYKSQMDAILTAEQKAQMAKVKAEHKAIANTGDWKKTDGNRRDTIGRRAGDKAKGDFIRKGGAGRGDMMKELNLTADQQQKVKSIQADFRTQLETVRKNESLSQEQKKAKFQELMKAQQEQMKTVLTKEQIEKMKSLRKERPAKGNVK